jgi:hypothetical protein
MGGYEKQLRQCIAGTYGNWALLQLPSGQWAGIWRAALGVEDMCEAIVKGTWFHDGNPSFSDRIGALEFIVKGIEREILNTRNPADKDSLRPFLQSACTALSRHLAKEMR